MGVRVQRLVLFAVVAGFAGIATNAAGQSPAVALQSASAFREPLYCSGGTSVLACDSGCSWGGTVSSGVVQLSGGVSGVSDAAGCTRWTYYASGSAGGGLARGQRLRLTYDIRPVVASGGTARIAYLSLGGSRGGTDIVAAGVGPVALLGTAERTGTVATPPFVTGTAGGSGTWNLEMVVEWQPDAGSTFSMQIPASGFRVEIVSSGCPADIDGDGGVTPADVSTFINRWLSSLTGGGLEGDFDGNGVIEPADVALFVATWLGAVSGGCS